MSRGWCEYSKQWVSFEYCLVLLLKQGVGVYSFSTQCCSCACATATLQRCNSPTLEDTQTDFNSHDKMFDVTDLYKGRWLCGCLPDRVPQNGRTEITYAAAQASGHGRLKWPRTWWPTKKIGYLHNTTLLRESPSRTWCLGCIMYDLNRKKKSTYKTEEKKTENNRQKRNRN